MRDQPLGVVEEQAGALVGGDAAGEAEGEDVGIEADAPERVWRPGGEEALLGARVAGGDLARGDAVDGAEVVVVVAPARGSRCRAAPAWAGRARWRRGRRW